jgi:hypothetical protein
MQKTWDQIGPTGPSWDTWTSEYAAFRELVGEQRNRLHIMRDALSGHLTYLGPHLEAVQALQHEISILHREAELLRYDDHDVFSQTARVIELERRAMELETTNRHRLKQIRTIVSPVEKDLREEKSAITFHVTKAKASLQLVMDKKAEEGYHKHIGPNQAIVAIVPDRNPAQYIVQWDTPRNLAELAVKGSPYVRCVVKVLGTTHVQHGLLDREIPHVKEVACLE